MAEAQNGNGQSMDDILASIRRIISDEPAQPLSSVRDADARDAGALSSVHEGDFEHSAQKQPDDLSDILEPGSSKDGGDGATVAAHETIRDDVISEPTPWPFGRDDASKPSDGSLKNKLASLDALGERAMSFDQAPPQNDQASVPVEISNVEFGRRVIDEPAAAADHTSSAVHRDVGEARRPNSTSAAVLGKETQNFSATPEPVNDDRAADNSGSISLPIAAINAGRKDKPATALAGSVESVERAVTTEGQHIPSAEPVALTPEPLVVVPPNDNIEAATGVDGRERAKPTTNDADEVGVGVEKAASSAPIVIAPTKVEETVPIAIAPTDTTKNEPSVPASGDSKTLDSLVADALQPLLREWLDANLPRLVEERLDVELNRLAQDRKSKDV